ncbi:amino acid permease-domain-containing protein [Dipodascopsis tothii]|uniref:amino acid permease-domain-containing protein n=1 Tax=Dipodascopsis tothii TaxID=44089 RepID=UPI0034CF342A
MVADSKSAYIRLNNAAVDADSQSDDSVELISELATERTSDNGIPSASTRLLGASDESDADSLPGVPIGGPATGSGKLGVTSAVFLILNKMIGTGIFSTPSGVFAASGSVGMSLVLWIFGGLLSLTGLSVFLEFGLAIPKSGGEKNYLERVYKKPKYLVTCIFLAQMILLGFSAGNSLAFGRYLLFALGYDFPGEREARIVAVCCISFVVALHSLRPNMGTRLFNILGTFKVIVLLIVVFTGFAALLGWLPIENPNNFENAFENAGFGGGTYNYAVAILRIVYSYRGWENANYVMGELKNPKRTLMVAAPLAIGGVMVLYFLAVVAYFAVIPKEEIATSGVIVAGLFFRRVFGTSAGARVLPLFVALSNLGNVLVVAYAHARVNYEFARERILPYSKFWAFRNRLNAPVAGLFMHWLVTVIVLAVPPPGEAYEFIIDLNTYPSAWINLLVAAGLLYLQFNKREQWSSPFHSPYLITGLYVAANLFLMYMPLVKIPGQDGHPGFAIAGFGMGFLFMGVLYWLVWSKILPFFGGYRIEDENVCHEDGTESICYIKVMDTPR